MGPSKESCTVHSGWTAWMDKHVHSAQWLNCVNGQTAQYTWVPAKMDKLREWLNVHSVKGSHFNRRNVQLTQSKCTLNKLFKCPFDMINFANLFYYSAYFCYYSWVSLHFLVLFIGSSILLQLTFIFMYSTFNEKLSVSAK